MVKGLTSIKKGSGLKLGSVDMLYANPQVEGMTMFSYKNSKGKTLRFFTIKSLLKMRKG